ncbi:hypothetical protein [Colwellia sp. MEBiC06753]
MKFSSNQIQELAKFSTADKQQILVLTQQYFSVPEKLSLNLIKLILLIPPFLMLARQEWLFLIITVALSLLGLLGIMRPLSLRYSQKYLDKAIKVYTQ